MDFTTGLLDWLAGARERLTDGLDNLRASFGGLEVFGDVMSAIFTVLGFLGPVGLVLFVLSLVLMMFFGSFSPLPKLANYLLVVGLVSLAATTRFGEFDGVMALGGGFTAYLVVMLAPLVIVYGLKFGFARAFGGRSEAQQLKEAVTELTEQVAALRRDRVGAEPERERPYLTIDASAREPRRLVRRLGLH